MIEWMTNGFEHNFQQWIFVAMATLSTSTGRSVNWFHKVTMTTKSVATQSGDHNR